MKISSSGLRSRKLSHTSQTSDVRPLSAPHFLRTIIQVADVRLARVKSQSHLDKQVVVAPSTHTSIRLVSIPNKANPSTYGVTGPSSTTFEIRQHSDIGLNLPGKHCRLDKVSSACEASSPFPIDYGSNSRNLVLHRISLSHPSLKPTFHLEVLCLSS